MTIPPAPRALPGKSRLATLLVTALKWACVGVCLLATAALSGYLSMRKAVKGGEVTVPAVHGMSIPEATERLNREGLVLEKSGDKMDPLVPEGMVVSQEPADGSRLKRNRKVRVLVSLGKEVLKVPELVGQPARRAQIGLQQSGLKLGQIAYATSGAAEADRILAQEPPPGTQRIREGTVDLLVSKGNRAKVWVMPSVEGRDLASVTRQFSQAGLRITNVRREAPRGDVPSGVILQQYPLSGYPLREGDSISLTVSAEVEDHG
jgi:eukaryotic-like serine/threonine-protein kinase